MRGLSRNFEPSRHNMSPLGPVAIIKLSIREFVFETQMILREHFRVGLELLRVHRSTDDTLAVPRLEWLFRKF